jgi:hypothetical protein
LSAGSVPLRIWATAIRMTASLGRITWVRRHSSVSPASGRCPQLGDERHSSVTLGELGAEIAPDARIH